MFFKMKRDVGSVQNISNVQEMYQSVVIHEIVLKCGR